MEVLGKEVERREGVRREVGWVGGDGIGGDGVLGECEVGVGNWWRDR